MALGWLKNRLKDVADAAWDAVTEVADAAVDAVGEAAAATGDVVGAVGGVVDAATLGVASDVLHVVDNTVLDAVDEVTGGIIDVDYDGGNITAGVGVEGVLHVGAAVGEDGIRHSASAVNQGFDVGLTDAGLEASGEAGIDWGPLPYAGGDLTIGADGDVAFEGRAQGTLPTPYGIFSGEAEAEFVREGEDWGGRFDSDGSWTLPNGSTLGGGLDVGYMEVGDDSAFNLDVDGSYTMPGYGTVGGSFGYERVEAGGVLAQQYDADAYATGYGVRVEAGVSHTSVTTAEGSTSDWDTRGGVSVPVLGDVFGETTGPAQQSPAEPAPMEPAGGDEPPTSFDQTIAAADDVEASVDDMFSDLG